MEDEKISGRIIIDTILANMRQQIEELRYSKIVPAAFDVYLHADDLARFESLVHEIAAEAVRALQESLDELNRASRIDRVRELVRRPRLPFKKVGPWVVRITRDPEGAVPRGRALVVSQITLAGADSFEGQRTRRLSTLSEPIGTGGNGASPEPAPRTATPAPSEPPPRPVATSAPGSATRPLAPAALADTATASDSTARTRTLAVLVFEDDEGAHRVPITAPVITLGRASEGSSADVQLATRSDVSRAHVRIRFHPEARGFSIEDLSTLGTKLNDEELERGVPRTLPSPSGIRLADTITVYFESEALP
jgi:hypothetical protein